jgi:hypothetical protein
MGGSPVFLVAILERRIFQAEKRAQLAPTFFQEFGNQGKLGAEASRLVAWAAPALRSRHVS